MMNKELRGKKKNMKEIDFQKKNWEIEKPQGALNHFE
jgi:hypothetical protein